jgi:hypothetical protein
MTDKPTPPRDDPAQSKRFIDMARELGSDETGEAFERAFKKVARPAHDHRGRDGAPRPRSRRGRE